MSNNRVLEKGKRKNGERYQNRHSSEGEKGKRVKKWRELEERRENQGSFEREFKSFIQ